MKFKVIRAFRDLDGIVKIPGCILEIEFNRAAKLRRLGLIGQIAPERAEIVPQKEEPAETKESKKMSTSEPKPIETAALDLPKKKTKPKKRPIHGIETRQGGGR